MREREKTTTKKQKEKPSTQQLGQNRDQWPRQSPNSFIFTIQTYFKPLEKENYGYLCDIYFRKNIIWPFF